MLLAKNRSAAFAVDLSRLTGALLLALGLMELGANAGLESLGLAGDRDPPAVTAAR
jgi:hypothetical protein